MNSYSITKLIGILALFTSFSLSAHPFLSDREEEVATEAEGKIVEFRIPKDTKDKPWNTREEAVQVTVGDTLRIYNDDTVDHYLHTPGKPCPHGTNKFKPGEYYDCKISKEADRDKDVCYDHQYGPKSRFYITAVK